MRPCIERFAFGAFVALSLSATAAQAQTPTLTSSSTDVLSALTSAPEASNRPLSAVSVYSPTVRPSFKAAAQTTSAPKSGGIAFGILGVITRASFHADSDFFNPKARTGGGFGFWIGGNRGGVVGFTSEFIYLTRNTDDGNGGQFKSHAIELPAVLHINLGTRSKNGAGVYALVGPVVSINLKQSLNNLDVSDNFKGADFGVMAGAGVEFFRIGIEGRGNWGLTNVSDGGDFSDSNAKQFSFELLGKFAFN